MRIFKSKASITGALALLLLLSACQPPANQVQSESTLTSAPASIEESTISTDLPLQSSASALCGSYFKAGDFTYRMQMTPGAVGERDVLGMTFQKKDTVSVYADWSNILNEVHEFRLPYMADASLYDIQDVSAASSGSAYTVELNKDGSISLRGDTEAAGDYYEYNGSLILPDALKRPLNDTDLIGLDKEMLFLSRNQYYALYGRKFQKEELRQYFESQPWYRGTVPADEFDENILGGLYKRNIAFLKSAEDTYDQTKALALKGSYDSLAEAPYLDLLPAHGEIYLMIDSDSEHMRDEGIYYKAQGTISVPVTLSEEQYKTLEAGLEVELVMDELSSEKAALKKNTEGDYILTPLAPEQKELWYQVFLSYEPFSGTFSMWINSVDTIFKTVYEGDIYVLKGACEEYYRHFDVLEKCGEAAGSYRVIDFDPTSDSFESTSYQGNAPVFDSKGYLKALYFWGD